MQAQEQESFQAFISYSHSSHRRLAKFLWHWLEKGSHNIWLDSIEIDPATKWLKEIHQGIDRADNMIFLMSADALISPVCQLELARTRQNGRRIFCVYLIPPPAPTDKGQEFNIFNALKKPRNYALQLYAGMDDEERIHLGSDDDECISLIEENLKYLASWQWIMCCDIGYKNSFKQLLRGLEENRSLVEQHSKLVSKYREWESQNKSSAYLLGKKQLKDNLTWIDDFKKSEDAAKKKPVLSKELQGFLDASQKHEKRKKIINQSTWAWLVLFTFIAVIFLTVFLSDLLRQNELKNKAMVEMAEFEAAEVLLGVAELDKLRGTGREWQIDAYNLQPEELVFVNAFRLDTHEVSFKQYGYCVEAGACESLELSPDFEYEEDWPVSVDAYQAWNYCEWLDKRLPSRAEWERAARFGNTIWPWGDEAPSSERVNMLLGNQSEEDAHFVAVQSEDYILGVVPSNPPLWHMLGNMREWTSTIGTCSPGTCENQWNGTDAVQSLAIVGFLYSSGIQENQTNYVSGAEFAAPDESAIQTGFRCAQSIESVQEGS
jgi:formylglycine-generating enzyme required for sulfatase activity